MGGVKQNTGNYWLTEEDTGEKDRGKLSFGWRKTTAQWTVLGLTIIIIIIIIITEIIAIGGGGSEIAVVAAVTALTFLVATVALQSALSTALSKHIRTLSTLAVCALRSDSPATQKANTCGWLAARMSANEDQLYSAHPTEQRIFSFPEIGRKQNKCPERCIQSVLYFNRTMDNVQLECHINNSRP